LIETDSAKILDYGGGKGHLMHCFLKAGHNCAVVDYVKETSQNVWRFGSTIEDIPKNSKFDVIICNHVLEHLYEPSVIIRKLTDNLSKKGIIYIEVPLEIWDKIPLPKEPVTHINFFTLRSLKILLELAGLNVLKCEEGEYIKESGDSGIAVRAIAKYIQGINKINVTLDGSFNETKKLISPSIFKKIDRIIKYPKKTFKDWAKINLPKRFFWRLYS